MGTQAQIGLDSALPDSFTRFHQPVDATVTAQAPGYSLPLDLSRVANPEVAERLTAEQRALLARNGFVLVEAGPREDLVAFYKGIEDATSPVWVTPDALLHVYHLQFGETLREIEETILLHDLAALTQALLDASRAHAQTFSGELAEAARRNVDYLTVAYVLLEQSGEPLGLDPGPISDDARSELEYIAQRTGFQPSPIFRYDEDYSQYVPRGHYTRSEALKAYFRTMMWYGRMTMLLKGRDVSDTALVSAEDARIQTLQAALLATLLHQPVREGKYSLGDLWGRIYNVTAFFVGFSDDLTPRQYAEEIVNLGGTAFAWSALAEPQTLTTLRERLALLPSPRIYGGTGDIEIQPPLGPEQLDQALADTAGMRLMGQRYVPDSYMFQRLIQPVVGAFVGEGQPFTMEITQGGPLRCWARGLDVMAVLGSDRALALLEAEGDTAYERYDDQLQALREEFAALGEEDWSRTLYWGWLDALRALTQPRPEGYPHFMRTAAWEDRQLHAALASWAQLRHDTILYAKQPYGMRVTAMPPMPEAPPSPGFVEPLPQFYARLLALTRMTREGLQAMGALPAEAGGRMQATEDLLARLLDISRSQLAGEPLTPEQENVLKHFSGFLEGAVSGLDEESVKTTIVADVQTEMNTEQVLEQGTGYLLRLVGAYSSPSGHVYLGQGAALSYYEFKHPMADRLTNEAWRERLASDPPAPPPWTQALGR